MRTARPVPAGPKRLAAAAAVPAVHEIVRDDIDRPLVGQLFHEEARDAIVLARTAERGDTLWGGGCR